MHLSPRDRIRDLNWLKESEEAATFPAHGKASSFWSTSSGSPTIRIKEDGSRGGLERNQSGSAAPRRKTISLPLFDLHESASASDFEADEIS